MSTKFWEKQESPGDVYCDIWDKFWGKPLQVFESKVDGSGDGGDSMAVDMTFEMLTIHAGFRPLLETNGSLMVRQEYLDAVVALNERYEKKFYTGAIVIGHPGIGKSWFLYYLLVRRLSERKKTILNFDPSEAILLFDSSGYYIFRGRYIMDLSPMADGAWALLDSQNRTVLPNPLLTSTFSPVFMVFSCSPNENRYKDYHIQKRAIYYVMKNWTFDEIWAGATLRRADKVDKDTLHGYFKKYGPSARIMYTLYDGETTSQDETIKKALQNITADDLERLVSMAKGDILGTPDQQKVSHSVILASPHPDNRAMLRGEIITPHVFQLLEAKLFENDIIALVKTYKLFYDVDISETSVTCGWLFECYCHQMLYKHGGRKLKLFPLTVSRKSVRGKEKIPFMLCHRASVDPPSDLDLTLAHRESHLFDKQDALTLSDAKYYRPIVKNNASYDAFMTDADSALAFQFTISEAHDVAQSGIDDLQTRINNRPVKFILLVPEQIKDCDIHLDMPKTVWDMKNLKFYMAAVEVKVFKDT